MTTKRLLSKWMKMVTAIAVGVISAPNPWLFVVQISRSLLISDWGAKESQRIIMIGNAAPCCFGVVSKFPCHSQCCSKSLLLFSDKIELLQKTRSSFAARFSGERQRLWVIFATLMTEAAAASWVTSEQLWPLLWAEALKFYVVDYYYTSFCIFLLDQKL